MKKQSLFVLAFTFVLSLSVAFAQQNCGVINDETGTLTSSDISSLNTAATRLIDQGIMPHVIFAKSGGATAAVEARYEATCPSWTMNGQRAANLLSFVVIPSAKLKNVYFGGALTPAFGGVDAVNNRFSQAANPFFRQGNFGGGIAAAMGDFGRANAAFHDQAKHPIVATTTVTQQATDLKPVASIFGWLFFLIFLGCVVALCIWYFLRRNSIRNETEAVQQAAQGAMQKATNAFRAADSSNPGYADVAAQYSTLSGSVSYDPNSSGLSAAIYRTMADAWSDLYSDILALRGRVPDYSSSSVPKSTFAAAAGAATCPAPVAPPLSYRGPEPTVTQPTVIHETTYVDRSSGGNDLLTGMLVGEAISNNREDREFRREDYERPREEEERPSSGSDSLWSSSSSDDDSSSSSSGSDSSWGDSSSSDSGSGSDSGW